jgi:hypothetical protein
MHFVTVLIQSQRRTDFMKRNVFPLAKRCNIDLFKFIDLKMKYNELRPYKNGKKY